MQTSLNELKEIVGNESQERMGLILSSEDANRLKKIAERERAPFYVVGEVTNDHHFSFYSKKTNEMPIDLEISALFGSSPMTIMEDNIINNEYIELAYTQEEIKNYIISTYQS